MKLYTHLLFCLVILCSCNDIRNNKQETEDSISQDSLAIDDINQVYFDDIIPKNISDSSKTETIKRLIQEIDNDTSLILKEIIDSSNSNVYAYYKDDLLVKIIKGFKPGVGLFENEPSFMRYHFTEYYFFMDSLIFSRYECNSFQQTGRCNSVAIRINSFIYNRQIIFQEIVDKIGPYDHCGCDYPPSFGPRKEGYPELNYKMIMLLREQVINANIN
jgi:hypothetical protein